MKDELAVVVYNLEAAVGAFLRVLQERLAHQMPAVDTGAQTPEPLEPLPIVTATQVAREKPAKAKPKPEAPTKALTYKEDIAPRALELLKIGGREAIERLMLTFGLKKNLSEVQPEQYAVLLDAIETAVALAKTDDIPF